MHKLLRYIIAIMVGSPLCSASLLAQGIVLSPKDVSEHHLVHPQVQIGEVFEVQAPNQSIMEQVGALTLTEFRTPEHAQNIYEFHLTRILSEAGYKNVRIHGDFPITVKAESRTISSKEISQRIDSYFAENSPAKIDWSYSREPDLSVFPGTEYHLNFSHSGEILPGRMALRVELRNGNYSTNTSIMLNTVMRERVLVATENLTRGMTISDGNTQFREIELDIYQARHAITDAELNDIEVVRDIEAGEPVLSNAIQRVEVVRTGDNVRLYVDMGRLRVESLGTAVESGGISEKIKVRDSRSGSIVVGTIVDNQTIKILPQENL